MEVMIFGYILVGLVCGAAIGYLVARLLKSEDDSQEKARSLALELQFEQERAKHQQNDIQQLNEQLKREREQLLQANSERARLDANYKNLTLRLQEQKQEVAQLQDRFAAQFKNLANDIFEEKSKKFTDQNRTNLDEILKPLGQKLTDFERKVEQTHKDDLERGAALREQIMGLRELNRKMSEETENLTKALKGDTRIQGNWGEVVLERILEQSGLKKDREYFTQESITTEAGRRLRPDVIIRLPENKNLVIDAKASLVSYERYINADGESEKAQHLKEHLVSVRSHIKGLSQKSYHQLFETGSLDYVLMFVPIEAAFALIIEEGGELYGEANNLNIVIVSPATLMATLRTVASIWKHEYQNQNALEIARQGGALYDKFKSFVDDLVKVGQSLTTTKSTYEEAMKKLVNGKDNLVRKTERLKELGAKTTKDIDPKVLHRAEIEKVEEGPTYESMQKNLF